MTARHAKQNVDDPAARPSSPSVRLTALAAADDDQRGPHHPHRQCPDVQPEES